MVDIGSLRRVHCVGIGGIGVSAIALMLKERGVEVTGSDVSESHVTESLISRGIPVYIGHDASRVSDGIDCLIYSIAVTPDDPERQEAARLGVPQISYPEMLGAVSASMKTIAVSGTHGKTTTTAMTARAMIECSLDPTVVVGSFMADPKSAGPDSSSRNFIAGKGEYLVAEACEYRRSFLNISPFVLVITTIDADHLDYYKDLADIQNAFHEMAMKVPADGAIVCDPKSPNIAPVLQGVSACVIDYTEYLGKDDKDSGHLSLKVPGEHNRRNAAAARAVLAFLNADDAAARAALESFPGTWRRFEYKGTVNAASDGAKVYDDYAHHPAEIRATLQGARELYPTSRIFAVFQPHLYSRTKDLFDDFVAAFDAADQILLAPIYAAREPFDPAISSDMLAKAIGEKARSFADFDSIDAELKKTAASGDVILVMGAGDIYKVAESLVAGSPAAM